VADFYAAPMAGNCAAIDRFGNVGTVKLLGLVNCHIGQVDNLKGVADHATTPPLLPQQSEKGQNTGRSGSGMPSVSSEIVLSWPLVLIV
jgi:hypothetical protein